MQNRIIDSTELGNVVRTARKAQGMTQKDLSRIFSAFSREFLSDLENGKPTVELGKTLSVLSALGIRVVLEYDDDSELGGAS